MITKKRHRDGTTKVVFTLPDAGQPVSVVGDFNGWDPYAHPMRRRARDVSVAPARPASARRPAGASGSDPAAAMGPVDAPRIGPVVASRPAPRSATRDPESSRLLTELADRAELGDPAAREDDGREPPPRPAPARPGPAAV